MEFQGTISAYKEILDGWENSQNKKQMNKYD